MITSEDFRDAGNRDLVSLRVNDLAAFSGGRASRKCDDA